MTSLRARMQLHRHLPPPLSPSDSYFSFFRARQEEGGGGKAGVAVHVSIHRWAHARHYTQVVQGLIGSRVGQVTDMAAPHPARHVMHPQTLNSKPQTLNPKP